MILRASIYVIFLLQTRGTSILGWKTSTTNYVCRAITLTETISWIFCLYVMNLIAIFEIYEIHTNMRLNLNRNCQWLKDMKFGKTFTLIGMRECFFQPLSFLDQNFSQKISKLLWRWKLTSIGLIWDPNKFIESDKKVPLDGAKDEHFSYFYSSCQLGLALSMHRSSKEVISWGKLKLLGA